LGNSDEREYAYRRLLNLPGPASWDHAPTLRRLLENVQLVPQVQPSNHCCGHPNCSRLLFPAKKRVVRCKHLERRLQICKNGKSCNLDDPEAT
jgi:hypothetical protein